MDQQSVKKIITVVLMELCLSWQAHAQQTIINVNPPLFGFYAKYLDCGGIPIRAAGSVDDRALHVAAQKIDLVLAKIPNVRRNLTQWGAEVHIISQYQQTSDLPEYRDQKGVKFEDHGTTTDIDERTRGMGGIYSSCGEENLLHLAGDRYRGSDICIHEFAHNVLIWGLPDAFQDTVIKHYQNVLKKGLWKDAYAASNVQEYWAELSMWYFGSHGEFLKGTQIPAPGPEGLKKYDAEGYAILDNIYSGRLHADSITVTPAKKVAPGTISGIDKRKAVLMVVNNTGHNIKLFWVDFSGKEHPYGEMPAYNRNMQLTYVSNVWKITDEKGKVLGYFSPISIYAMATIN